MYNLGWTPTVDSRSGSGVLSALFGAVGHDAWKPSKYATPHHQSALGFFRVGTVPQNMEKAGEIYRPKKCINTRSSGYSSLWAGWPQRLPQGGG